MGKQERQDMILSLIAQQEIATQTGLTERLQQAGLNVTQATVSRDLQELRIVKVVTPNGGYRYVQAKEGLPQDHVVEEKLQGILTQCAVSVDYACNIVVVKTLSGAAQAACYALDSFVWEEVVGTIAGDDTIMMVTRSEKKAKALAERMTKYII